MGNRRAACWRKGFTRAYANTFPLPAKPGNCILLWLQPISDLAVFLPFVRELAHFGGGEHEAFRDAILTRDTREIVTLAQGAAAVITAEQLVADGLDHKLAPTGENES